LPAIGVGSSCFPLPGATNRTLELSRLQSSQSGDYSVVVADALESATSVAVWLEVDLLIEAGGRLHAVEIKRTATPLPGHAHGLVRLKQLVGDPL